MKQVNTKNKLSPTERVEIATTVLEIDQVFEKICDKEDLGKAKQALSIILEIRDMPVEKLSLKFVTECLERMKNL